MYDAPCFILLNDVILYRIIKYNNPLHNTLFPNLAIEKRYLQFQIPMTCNDLQWHNDIQWYTMVYYIIYKILYIK